MMFSERAAVKERGLMKQCQSQRFLPEKNSNLKLLNQVRSNQTRFLQHCPSYSGQLSNKDNAGQAVVWATLEQRNGIS